MELTRIYYFSRIMGQINYPDKIVGSAGGLAEFDNSVVK
jgi:hypothetical protein